MLSRIPTASLAHRTAAAAAAATAHFVACNVYITAGGHVSHCSALLRLLAQTQAHCAQQCNSDNNNNEEFIAMVHAYTDTTYNRTSFHLVGKTRPMATVVSDLVTRAMAEETFLQTPSSCSSITGRHSNDSAHPTVGLVDHIAVMPLSYDENDSGNDYTTSRLQEEMTDSSTLTPSGQVARLIGNRLQEQHQTTVHYYGAAHPDNVPLATVRREKTSFFQRNHAIITQTHQNQHVTTVGAPLGFVENYNIRVNCTSRSLAVSLTKRLRKPGTVEALTLTYGNEYEVACNLLRPNIVSAQDLQAMTDIWKNEQGETVKAYGYRVGTTIDQCLETLAAVREDRASHDNHITACLGDYLSKATM